MRLTAASASAELLVKLIAERWPWLDDDGDNEPSQSEPAETVLTGGARWYGGYGPSGKIGDQLRSGHPLWILTGPEVNHVDWRIEIVDLRCDDAGRIGRVQWIDYPRFRPRGLYKPTSRGRYTLELFDYGVPVDIPIPPTHAASKVGARDVVRGIRTLRRRKREWQAQQ